jgi:hypothetical protein
MVIDLLKCRHVGGTRGLDLSLPLPATFKVKKKEERRE